MSHESSFFTNTLEEKIFWFLGTMTWAGYFLFLNIFFHLPGGITEKEEFLLFVQGWITVPIGLIAIILILETTRQKWFRGCNCFYFYFGLGALIFWALALWTMRILSLTPEQGFLKGWDAAVPSWETGEFVHPAIPQFYWMIILLGFPILSVMLLIC